MEGRPPSQDEWKVIIGKFSELESRLSKQESYSLARLVSHTIITLTIILLIGVLSFSYMEKSFSNKTLQLVSTTSCQK